jgi:Mg2+-importing ATPase
MSEPLDLFWSVAAADVLRQLQTTPQGLASADAARRLERVGPNVL